MLFLGAILLAVFVLPDAWDLPVVALGAVLETAEVVVGIRLSRRGAVKVGPETLVGQTAEVVVACRPAGRVKLRGEQWLARCEEGAEVGQRVRVCGRNGLTLVVEQIEPVSPSPSRSVRRCSSTSAPLQSRRTATRRPAER